MNSALPGSMPLILLATSRDFPHGEPGVSNLIAALAKQDIIAKCAIWDDPDVRWGDADLIAIRSTWDYQDKLTRFLDWVESNSINMLHGPHIFRWNTNKSYLLGLCDLGVPIVPTRYATTIQQLKDILGQEGKHVVKPATGGSGVGVEATRSNDPGWSPSLPGPWVVQPFVESVLNEGETTVFIIGGKITAQISKIPAKGEFRVHEEYGGQVTRVAITREAEDIAHQAYYAAEKILESSLSYARLDLLRYKGQLVVSEVEITEPQLCFDVIPEHAELFASVLQCKIGR